jgi:(p)ppGpp synthase/HD superfamily hydrolase
MDLSRLLAKAISIAAVGFEGVLDKGGRPYILHCLRVMNRMDDDEGRILGVLHDVIEDGVKTSDQLLDAGFPKHIVDQLQLLTHYKEIMTYDEYVQIIGIKSPVYPRIRKVKLYDLEDNSSITRLKGVSEKDVERMKKYHHAYIYLNSLQ